MYRLAVDTGLAASLCVLENYRVVLLDRVEGPSFVRTVVAADGIDRNINDSSEAVQSQYLSREQRDIGIVLPPYTTAMGRALLAHIPKDRLNDFIAKVPIAGEPVSARAAQRQFLITLQEVRAQGYCLVEREQHTRSCALAAPIFDSQGALKAAVGVSCQRHSPVWDEEAALAETVRDAAWRISSRLKHNSTLASREREPMSDRI